MLQAFGTDQVRPGSECHGGSFNRNPSQRRGIAGVKQARTVYGTGSMTLLLLYPPVSFRSNGIVDAGREEFTDAR